MAKLQARIQDFEMGGGVNFCNNVIEPKPGWGVWGLCINMIEEGFRKKGGGGENSPISPPWIRAWAISINFFDGKFFLQLYT